jgi:hypothetical protein
VDYAGVCVVPMWEVDVQDGDDSVVTVAGDRGERRVAVPSVLQVGCEREDGRTDELVRAIGQASGIEQRHGAGNVTVVEVVGVEPGQVHGSSKPLRAR